METELVLAMQHLKLVLVLVQIPRENWTDDDLRAFNEARKFVQGWKERHEGQGT